MSNSSYLLQITSTWPGALGGAIFKGVVVGGRNTIVVKASYKIVTRPPLVGEFWRVDGTLQRHPDYGDQLIANSCTLSHLPSEKYLGSLLKHHPKFRGFHFGKAKAEKLLREIGASALIDILDDGNVLALSDILNPAIAERLVNAWEDLKTEIDTIQFLMEHNFDAALSHKVIKLAKKNTVERLKSNPYALICFGGITVNIWRTLELVARKLRIPKDDSRRLVAAVEHVLYKRLRDGHTAIYKDDLKQEVEQLLRSNNLADQAIVFALKAGAACVTLKDGAELIQPIGPAYIEHLLERRLERLRSGSMQMPLFQSDLFTTETIVEKYSAEFQRENGFSLTVDQLDAITLALTEQCFVLSGFGGTGKTTVLKAITDISNAASRTCYLMALSGKAKERMTEATGHEAMTIHAFIKAVSEGSDRIDLHCNPKIIIDEASMVDIALLNKLLSLFDGLPFSLLMVGDTAQISPVGFGLAYHLMAKSQNIPKVHLTSVHRQAESSPIHKAAMALRNAEMNELDRWRGGESGIFLEPTTKENLLEALVSLKMKIPEAQILTPHMSERLPDSAHIINREMQERLNPPSDQSAGINVGSVKLREGDPVIVTDNNYELGLFNGTTGILSAVGTNSMGQQCGLFEFENIGESTELTLDQIFDLGIQLAYAISIHKSQGSEYDSCIICCVTQSRMVERSLLYTAITRPKKLCVVAGTQQCYDIAARAPSRADTLCVGFEI